MSSDLAIDARKLGKDYRIRTGEQHTTLLDSIAHRARHPFARSSKEQFWALRDLTFEVPHGEVLGLIGRNGAGKSTLLKVLARITAPSTGRATIDGRLGSLLEVGTGFHPELTGRENIFLNGTVLGMRRREVTSQYDAIVEFAGVSQFLETPVKRYSSGMYVRLAFAVAAHLSVDVLLVDEVLAVGDAEFQKRSMGKMQDLAEHGRTVVFVSHSMESVRRICTRGLLLSHGALAASGTIDDVIREYTRNPVHATTRRQWSPPGPGTAEVRLRAVQVSSDDGLLSAPDFDIRRPLTVAIDYDEQMPGGRFALVSLIVKNEQGLALFATNSFHARRMATRGAGLRRATVTVPGNLLAEGVHTITVMLNEHGHTHHAEEDAVAFNVVDPGHGDSVRGDYSGPWTGVMRPMLPWHVQEGPDLEPSVGTS